MDAGSTFGSQRGAAQPAVQHWRSRSCGPRAIDSPHVSWQLSPQVACNMVYASHNHWRELLIGNWLLLPAHDLGREIASRVRKVFRGSVWAGHPVDASDGVIWLAKPELAGIDAGTRSQWCRAAKRLDAELARWRACLQALLMAFGLVS